MKPLPVVLAFTLALCVFGCSHTPKESTQHLTPYKILIDWQAEPTYLGLYYAKTLGKYEDLGLDVEIVQSWGANEAASAVASGGYEFGTCSGGATVIANSKGADLLSMAVLYDRLPTVVYGLAETGISSPKDLEGKTIGIYPKSITRDEFNAFAQLNHLDLDKVTIESISGADLPLVLSGQVDGVLNYFELSPTLLSLEHDTYTLPLDEYGVKGYGLNLITSRKAYSRNAELIRGLTAATLEGYETGCRDRGAAVDAFIAEFPERDRAYVAKSWDRVCEFMRGEYGKQDSSGWAQTIKLYADLGLADPAFDPAKMMP